MNMNNFGASIDANSVCLRNPVGSTNLNHLPLLFLLPTTTPCPDSVPYSIPKSHAGKCGNCCVKFPTPVSRRQVLRVGKYAAGVNGPKRTVFEGLQLLFKSRQFVTTVELNEELNDIQLCITCASQFQNLMTCYASFLRSSRPESYVSALQKEVSQHFNRSHELPKVVNSPQTEIRQTLQCHPPVMVTPSTSQPQASAVFTLLPTIASETQQSSSDLQSSKSEVVTIQKNVSQHMNKGEEVPKSVNKTPQKKLRTLRCRPPPPNILTPPTSQGGTFFTLLPPMLSKIQESNMDKSVKPEVITPDCLQDEDDYDYDTIMNGEDVSNSVNTADSSMKDPLSLPSTAITTIPRTVQFSPITFGPFGITPNILLIPPTREGDTPKLHNIIKVPGQAEPVNENLILPVLEKTTEEHNRSKLDPSNPKRSFRCQICNMTFRKQNGLSKHNRLQHAASYVELTEEQKSVIDFKKFKCDDTSCLDVVFGSFKEWVLHQENEHNVNTGYKLDMSNSDDFLPDYNKMRPCPICGRKCRSEVSTIGHIKYIHFNISEATCLVCQKPFSTQRVMELHMKNVHNTVAGVVVTRDYLCTYCGNSFPTKSDLRKHESCHLEMLEENRKRIVCNICQKSYTRKSEFNKHKMSHRDERNFVCDQCGSTFKLQSTLKVHTERVHYKRFILDEVCEVCGKKYAFKKTLKEHLMSIHKMDKEEARVSAKIKRVSLFRILPNGDRIFKEPPTKPKTCSICDRTYTRRENLFTHLMSVHGKSEEEAKNITGLKTKRNLIPTNSGGKTRRVRKRGKSSRKKANTSESESDYITEDEDK